MKQFKGSVLAFYGTEDSVIPTAVKKGYAAAASNAKSVEFVWLSGAGHKLHDWLATRQAKRFEVIDRILRALSR